MRDDYNEEKEKSLAYRTLCKIGRLRAQETRLTSEIKLHKSGVSGLEKIVDGFVNEQEHSVFEINKEDTYYKLAKKNIKINWP